MISRRIRVWFRDWLPPMETETMKAMKGLAVGIVVSVLAASCVGQAQEPQLRARACAEVLQKWYDPESGQWTTTSWWNAANALTALTEYTRATQSDTYREVLANSFDRCKYFEVVNDPEKAPWVCRDFINAWYDDEGWWVLLWLDVYELTGEHRYLEMAQRTFADMTRGWDEVCGGGVYWKKPNIGKHAITNGLFMTAALRLHRHLSSSGAGAVKHASAVNGASYLSWGERTWAWIQAKQLISEDFLVENGLDDACQIQRGARYTYNQGVMIGALLAYEEVTHDSKHVVLATRIADATISKLTTEDGVLRESKEPEITGDSAQFKGIFMRNLSALYRKTRQPRHAVFIKRNAEKIWTVARDAQTGEIGGVWSGPFDKGDAARQSSALDALNAAIVVHEP